MYILFHELKYSLTRIHSLPYIQSFIDMNENFPFNQTSMFVINFYCRISFLIKKKAKEGEAEDDGNIFNK